jgi:SPP1 gp7 family putative phage head morphogenesis protein
VNPTTNVLDMAMNISLTPAEQTKYLNLANDLLRQLNATGNPRALSLALRVQGVSELNRLNSLKNLINLQLGLASNKEEKILTKHLEGIYTNEHYRATENILKNSDVLYNSGFVSIQPDVVERIVSEPWTGNKNYSDRIWSNNYNFTEALDSSLKAGIAQGKSVLQMSNILADKMNVKYYQAERLIRTESSYFIEDSNKSAYMEMGVEQYVFIATLDNRVRPTHAEKDNNVYRYDQAMAGDNYPPLAVNCRCTVSPYFADTNELISQRVARDKNGNNVFVPATTKASDYIKIFQN